MQEIILGIVIILIVGFMCPVYLENKLTAKDFE